MTFDLTSERPFSAALVLDDGELAQFGRLAASPESSRLNVRLYFMPFDWHKSDAVDVGLYQNDNTSGAGIFVRVDNAALKLDPRPFVDIHTTSGEYPLGSVLKLGLVRSLREIQASAVSVERSDQAIVHGRWKLRGSIEVPAELGFLHSGRRKGNSAVPRER